jgi:sensor histidine kinase YesM
MKIADDQIQFFTENSMGRSAKPGDLQHSGIGLDNVKKRLGLLFPGKYELKIEDANNVFKVALSIRKEKRT